MFDHPVRHVELPPERAFPIRGPHELQRWEDNGFGGARGHQGQDMFARCGTPVVAAEGGRVRHAGFEGAAGHYVVIRGTESHHDAVYMHLRRPSPLREGDRVDAAGRVGDVGHSGDASGCHLHFELGPGRAGTAAARPTTRCPGCAAGIALDDRHDGANVF